MISEAIPESEAIGKAASEKVEDVPPAPEEAPIEDPVAAEDVELPPEDEPEEAPAEEPAEVVAAEKPAGEPTPEDPAEVEVSEETAAVEVTQTEEATTDEPAAPAPEEAEPTVVREVPG